MPITNDALFCGCAPRQESLDSYFGKTLRLGTDRGDYGLMQFLLGAENNRGLRRISDDILTTGGKKRSIILNFDEDMCFDVCFKDPDCKATPTNYSTTDDCVTYSVENVYTPCNEAGENIAYEITCEALDMWCERNDQQFIQDKFNKFDMQFFKGLNKSMMQSLQTQVVASGGAALQKDVKIFCQGAGSCGTIVNPDLFSTIDMTFEDAGLYGQEYVILGGRIISQMKNALKIQTASCEGTDISQWGSFPPMYYDSTYDAIFGNNSFIALPIGAVNLIEYAENMKACRKVNGSELIQDVKFYNLGNGVMIPFDYKWKADFECGTMTYSPSVSMDMISCMNKQCGATEDFCFIPQFTNCVPLETGC